MTDYVQGNNHLTNELLLGRKHGDQKKVQKHLEVLKGEKKKLSTQNSISSRGEKPFKNEGKGEIKILSHKGKLKDTSPIHLLYLQYKRQKYAERK